MRNILSQILSTLICLISSIFAEVYKPVYVASLSVAGPYYTNNQKIEFRDREEDLNSTATIRKKLPRHYTLLPNILRMHFILGNNM